MKLKSIQVRNLFGMFTHSIDLNTDENITIIFGPNGLGKTTLLAMLDALFRPRHGFLRHLSFEELVLTFDDRQVLRLERRTRTVGPKKPRTLTELVLRLSGPGTATGTHVLADPTSRFLGFPVDFVDRHLEELLRVGPERWFNRTTGESLTLEDVFDRYSDRLPMPPDLPTSEPPWMTELRGAFHVRFIETQRLLCAPGGRRSVRWRDRPSLVPSVEEYSEELAAAIQAKLAEYAASSQSLHRSLLARLVKGEEGPNVSVAQVRRALSEFEAKRSRLMAVGFLDNDQEVVLPEIQSIDETNKRVLSMYVKDLTEKLGVLDELANKIDVFTRVVNGRFLYKQMMISRKSGFVFRTTAGADVLPSFLSSGEQHELVMLYELIFRVAPSSLILIDEPELSLHVVWQQQFLRDMQAIAKLVGFDVLLATHSPQIIHDRYDLAVELQGPPDDSVSHAQ